ncbi:MAG: hypothetical protein QNK37_34330 [Acidobacteriota bacterium]|nr:hypothetical protein [Acidobacteriota bacterium]
MKMELKPLIDSPLTEDEATQLNAFFDQLKADPNQKIVITLEADDKPSQARRKLAYMARLKNMTVTIKKTGNQVIATVNQPTLTKVPRLNREQVTAKVLTFLETQPGQPFTKTTLAAGSGLTVRQIRKVWTDLGEKGRLRIEGDRGEERVAFLAQGDRDETEKDRLS